jgi:hypothetical protein
MNTIFLTSMPLENQSDTSPKLNNINNFVTQLKNILKKALKILFIFQATL